MKKIFYLFILFLIFPVTSLASNDFSIDEYSLNINIKENSNYEVEENLKIEYYGNERYIKRNIVDNEHNLNINRNYTIETNETSIAKIYATSNSDDLKIKYNLKNISTKNNYYKVTITNQYEEEMNNLKFRLVLPESVTSKNIKIYNGEYDITDLVDYEVKENIVTGTYNKKIVPGSKIIFEIDYGRLYMSTSTLVCIIVPIVLTVFSYLLWRLFGKDLPSEIEKTSKFPKNVSALHIALANNGKITKDDTFSLLLDLAVKGYITINEKNDEFYLTRNKDYKESNYLESVFFKTLFRAGESITLSEYINIVAEKKDDRKKIYQADRVESSNLKKKFNNATNTVISILDERRERDKYYEEKPERIKNILLLMVALILILITSLPFIEINVLSLLPLSIILSIAILYVLITFIRNINIKNETHKSIIIFSLATIVLTIIVIPSFRRDIGFLIAFLVSLTCSGIILFIYKYMPRRTIYGQNIYNKSLGFQYFLNNIKKEEMDRIIEMNKNYLMEVLPISYQLGVSKRIIYLLKWYKIPEPTWYKGPAKFNYSRLNTALLNLKEILTKEDE